MINALTKDLSVELEKRNGVTSLRIPPYQKITITTGDETHNFTGPAVIIVNQD